MNSRKTKGFTLVELMVAVAILGILAAVAIPAFIKYMSRAKAAEAKETIKGIHQGAVSYFGNEWISQGTKVTMFSSCLPASAPRTPAALPSDQKYNATTYVGDFNHPSWHALKFQPGDDFYYQYEYVTDSGAACSITSAELTYSARGNLDADTHYSLFQRYAEVTPEGSVRGVGGYYQMNPYE